MKVKLNERERFIARDISWLKFNQRVLEESEDRNNPLLERARFLAICVNNLDEFLMVRLAGLKDIIASGFNRKDKFGYYPQELLKELKEEVKVQLEQFYKVYHGRVLKSFEKNDIHLCRYKDLNKQQRAAADEYFESTLYPMITPMGVDPGHPFPVLSSKTLSFAVVLKKQKKEYLAIVPVPKSVPRVFLLPQKESEYSFILIDEIIRHNLKRFFKGYTIKSLSLFRVIRNSELDVEEEFTPNLLHSIDQEVKKRVRSNVVYLEVDKHCSDELLEVLAEGLDFPVEDATVIDGPLDLTFLFDLIKNVDKPEFFYPSYVRKQLDYENIFEKIKEKDFILHVPYDSFDPTVDLIQTAARDVDVLAIKMTLYRTSKDSPIVEALKEAALNNKIVTVLVEIKARFDEQNNIRWVRELEDAGCHVIYGIPGFKVHAKMTLVIRREEEHIKRYVHLSTGNYNENTSKVYTDIGYFTANEDFASDISEIFNVVTGYSNSTPSGRLITSPNDMRDYISGLIEQEIKYHKKFKNGHIKIKLNSIEDTKMIDKLYKASCEGVKIELIVRGICCLIPGLKGVSDNIKVKSLVGRFLEHTRIFTFNNNGEPRVFLSSADFMKRNLDRRIELLFEITTEDIKQNIIDIIDVAWKDTLKTRWLDKTRDYKRLQQIKHKINAHDEFIRRYAE